MVAQTYKVSREVQDDYAFISHSRANKARRAYPVPLYLANDSHPCSPSPAGSSRKRSSPSSWRGQVVAVDDTIRLGVTREGLAALKPAFPQWGEASTTAGNASGVGDGAGLLIMTTRARAEKEGMPVLGKYITSTVVGALGVGVGGG